MSRRILNLVSTLLSTRDPSSLRIALIRPLQLLKRNLNQDQKDKQFVDKPTPYQRPNRQCILCKNDIRLSYKNPRLLSQFISPMSGNVYDKHITGLCEKQQTRLLLEVKKAKSAMYMPIFYRDPRFNKDPALFNPDRPQRPNPY